MMKRFATLAFVVAVALFAGRENDFNFAGNAPEPQELRRADTALATAYERQASNLQIHGEGEVVRVLADDNEGSRHQRFILKTATGQTVLVAHNIDLADRVPGLKSGDRVEFNGEYEWNAKGGVIHWTHHDPQGRHEAGWLKHKGTRYE